MWPFSWWKKRKQKKLIEEQNAYRDYTSQLEANQKAQIENARIWAELQARARAYKPSENEALLQAQRIQNAITRDVSPPKYEPVPFERKKEKSDDGPDFLTVAAALSIADVLSSDSGSSSSSSDFSTSDSSSSSDWSGGGGDSSGGGASGDW